MANPTTYFGWVMPTSTDLVTDLPADFNVFGQGVDTSMQDLLGGTTGQVLSKTSGTNMDFTWVTPTDQTPLTTKGDLFTFTTVDARLAVGANGETLVADSAATTGLRYQSAYNGNVVINGGYDIWQRGTTITCSSTAYGADRWNAFRGVAGGTVTRQVTGDTTNLPNIQYCARVSRDSANTSTSALGVFYSAETSDSIRFVGQTATLSFYARKGANFSAASANLSVEFSQGTGTDQNVIVGGFTGKTNVNSGSSTLTSTWQRFTYSGTVATTTTQLGLQFYFTPVGTAGAADYFEITGVQVELGSVPTTFKRSNGSGGTIQGELAACQRYYYRLSAATGQTNFYIGAGTVNASGNNAYIYTKYPTTMRVVPTFTFLSAGKYYIVSNPQGVATGVGTDNPGVDSAGLTFSKASMTAYASATIQANSASAYIEMSAEL